VTLRELTLDDRAAVQALLDRCAEFFLLSTGGPGSFDELWSALPAGRSAADKCLYAVCAPELAGVAEVIRDWPRAGTWIIGLLVLDPAARGRGIGAEAVAEIEARAAAEGAQRLRVAVVEANEGALRFWQRLGFTPAPPMGPGALAFERAAAGTPRG
jgi:RimJ/RimL family protein N-acetyltransferase